MREITTRPSEASEKTDYPPVGMYIDGEWIYDRETWRMVRNPSTENDLGPVPKATDADLDRGPARCPERFSDLAGYAAQ